MIIGKDVSKTYTGRPVLEHVDFKIGNGRKIGVVGNNGCGKTTLFKLISGELIPDSGTVQIQNEVITHLPQELRFPEELVGEYLEKKLDLSWEMYKIEALVDQLKFENYDPYQEIKTLSGGQKMKLKMVELLLEEPTTFLIDEPTNHLDIETKEVIEQSLAEYEGTLLLVSHDRYFVESVGVNKMLNLKEGNLSLV